jgi:hypothetical protein
VFSEKKYGTKEEKQTHSGGSNHRYPLKYVSSLWVLYRTAVVSGLIGSAITLAMAVLPVYPHSTGCSRNFPKEKELKKGKKEERRECF